MDELLFTAEGTTVRVNVFEESAGVYVNGIGGEAIGFLSRENMEALHESLGRALGKE